MNKPHLQRILFYSSVIALSFSIAECGNATCKTQKSADACNNASPDPNETPYINCQYVGDSLVDCVWDDSNVCIASCEDEFFVRKLIK